MDKSTILLLVIIACSLSLTLILDLKAIRDSSNYTSKDKLNESLSQLTLLFLSYLCITIVNISEIHVIFIIIVPIHMIIYSVGNKNIEKLKVEMSKQ